MRHSRGPQIEAHIVLNPSNQIQVAYVNQAILTNCEEC